MVQKRPGDILRALRPKFDRVRERARGLSLTSQVALGGAFVGALGLSALAIAAISASRQANKSMQEMSTVELLGLYAHGTTQFGTQSVAPRTIAAPAINSQEEADPKAAKAEPTKDEIARFCVSRVHELRDIF